MKFHVREVNAFVSDELGPMPRASTSEYDAVPVTLVLLAFAGVRSRRAKKDPSFVADLRDSIGNSDGKPTAFVASISSATPDSLTPSCLRDEGSNAINGRVGRMRLPNWPLIV